MREHAENIPEVIPVFVATDGGRDVDDFEALAYKVGSENTEVVGIATTHMIPDRRAMIARPFMAHLGKSDLEIGVGSIFPLGKEDESLVRYLREHTIQGRTYEGDGMIECFPPAEQVILDAIETHGNDLRIAALAPLTDLAKVAQDHPDAFTTIGGLHIQRQATIEDGRLVPDPQAYNIKEDEEAARIIFGMQEDVSMTLVGKFAAYQMPLTRDDFETWRDTGNPAGQYLYTHAIKGIQCFAERSPEIFERVFGVPADQVDRLEELSKPYDALVAMSIADPDHFDPIEVGPHKLIGMTPENPGIIDPAATKAKMVDTITHALRSSGTIRS